MPNISRSKDSQTLKFGQLIDCNTRSIFPEKSCTKCAGETIPRPFSKKSILSISLDQYFKVLQFAMILCQVEGYLKISKLSSRLLAFTSNKVFLKNKKRSGISSPTSFSA